MPDDTKLSRPGRIDPAAAATVLLVEDEASILNLVVASLNREGYHLLKASSGQEALDVVAASGRPLDLVLTDAQMPHMSGVDLARRLMEIYPDVAVVLMSGHDVDDLDGFGGADHLVAFLQKPFIPTELRAQIRTTLNARRQRLSQDVAPQG